MATSGYMSTSNTYVKFYVVVTTNEQSISGNWTSVNVDVYALRTNTGYTTYGSGTCTLTVNGENWSTSGNYSITSSATRIGGVSSLVIPHNSDGTKTLVVSAALNMSGILSSSVQNYSVVLNTIPRASHPTINVAGGSGSVNIGSSYMDSELRIFTHRVSASFRHKITVVYNGTTFTLCNYTDAMGNQGDVYYTFPVSVFAACIPSSTSATCTVYLETFSGSTSIGKYGCSFTLLLPTSVVPTISSLSTEIVHTSSPSAWGVMINGKSSLKVTINGPAPSTGASITQYYITGGGYAGYSNPYTTGVINNSGVLGFTATITDSRGFTATKTINSPTIYDYYNPYSSDINVFRCTSAGVANDDGTYLSIKATINYASCNSKNTYLLQYRTRETGGVWSSYATLTSNTATVAGAGAISVDKSYEVNIRAADYFTESIVTISVPTGYVTMDFKKGGKGIALGKVSETDNVLDVAWDTKVLGRTISVPYIAYANTNGTLIDLCAATVLQRMITVRVTGNGYGVYPINTIIQGYHYTPQGTIINCKQVNSANKMDAAKFMIYNGRFMLWFKQPSEYNTLIIEVFSNGFPMNNCTVSNSAEPAGTSKVTCSLANMLGASGDTAHEMYNDGWYRSTGSNGWYSETYGGGWYMNDTTWLRAYGDKSIYTGGTINAAAMTVFGNNVAESGSTDGNQRKWVRYYDGTQICHMNISISYNTSNQAGSIWYKTDYFGFPVSFINVPSVSCSFATNGVIWASATSSTTTTQAGFMVYSFGNVTYTGIMQIIAVGRWY